MNYALTNKCIRVLRSCRTLAQLKSAIRYINLAYKQCPSYAFRSVMISEWKVKRHDFPNIELEFKL